MFDRAIADKLSEIMINKQRLADYYEKLLINIKNEAERKQIEIIRDEEHKHMNILKSICARTLQGQVLTRSSEKIRKDLLKRHIERIIYLENSIIGTTKALMLSISDLRIRNGLYYILTDDQRHADMILFFYTKYS